MLLFDLETDGLLEELTRIHCLVIYDTATDTYTQYGPEQIASGVNRLENADCICGHNIMAFDIPAIRKVYPSFHPRGVMYDTLVISRLIFTDLKDRDFAFSRRTPEFPKNLIGRHGLEAWGWRLGKHKGDYAKEMKAKGLDPWAEFNADMMAYCVVDVEVTKALWDKFETKGFSRQSYDLEHGVWHHCLDQMRFGCAVNESAIVELYGTLSAERAVIERELKATFGCWYVSLGEFTPKRDNTKQGYSAGATMTKVELIEFNPSSREQIADRLIKVYGWKPSRFTSSGKPEVDEDTLSGLPYEPAKLLVRYFLLEKRIGQIAEGKQAWLKQIKNGRIHGRIETNGAVTGRATHNNPNLAQVPSVGAPYGAECRSCFTATPGWAFVGADASGLELRCLAHFLARWDVGEYGRIILPGDIHTANQNAAGFPPGKEGRNMAKTFIYALLYGAGDGKIGSIVGKGAKHGKELRARFMAALPAFANLVKAVQKAAARGYLIGLDGRQIIVRSPHAALNTLLQGAGAVIMKQAMVNFHAAMKAAGYDHGKDYRQVLWIHDEFQTECRPELKEIVGHAMVNAIRKVTDDFSLRCPLDGEFKVGLNWADTH